jgi:alanyl-tRNA synthetase
VTAEVKAIYFNKSFINTTKDIPSNEPFGILLDRTSFYAESGGQIYDTGHLLIDDAGDAGVADFEVIDVQVFNGYVLHIGYMKEGVMVVNDQVISQYDEVERQSSS